MHQQRISSCRLAGSSTRWWPGGHRVRTDALKYGFHWAASWPCCSMSKSLCKAVACATAKSMQQQSQQYPEMSSWPGPACQQLEQPRQLTECAHEQRVLDVAAPEHQVEQRLQLVAARTDDHAGVAAAGGSHLHLPPAATATMPQHCTSSLQKLLYLLLVLCQTFMVMTLIHTCQSCATRGQNTQQHTQQQPRQAYQARLTCCRLHPPECARWPGSGCAGPAQGPARAGSPAGCRTAAAAAAATTVNSPRSVSSCAPTCGYARASQQYEYPLFIRRSTCCNHKPGRCTLKSAGRSRHADHLQ